MQYNNNKYEILYLYIYFLKLILNLILYLEIMIFNLPI